jgi:23S rRNA (adenine2503-C2)-methyltransferase
VKRRRADAKVPGVAKNLNLRDLDLPDAERALGALGIPAPVARRIWRRVHREGGTGFTGIPGLREEHRRALEGLAAFPDLELVERRRAADGFVKYLFRLPDGHPVEAVRIPLPAPGEARALKERRRRGEVHGLQPLPVAKHTLCVSAQAGCALGCAFCATGRLGLARNLETWEILAQVRHVAADSEHPVRGVVFMGMGEPLLNYENVVRAATVLTRPAGMSIAAKAITISTAGVVPAIRRYTAEGHRFRLIVSLASPFAAERARLMPIERRWPLPELMAAVRDHARAIDDLVTLAYVAIGGVNLSAGHARGLAALLEGLRAKIDLIDVNDEAGIWHRPTEEEIGAFRRLLLAAGVPVVRRYSGGREIGAACGTLAATRAGGEVLGQA